jgi:hypothetical protein
MSGEAGAGIEAEYYGLFIGSGVCVSVAESPDDGSAIGAYFAGASAPYVRWLARAREDLDALFVELHAQGPVPLVAVTTPCEQIDGAIVEQPDVKARHFSEYHRGGPLMIHASSHTLLPDGQSLDLRVHVASRVRRDDLDALLGRVAAVLLTHAAEPAATPAPTPPPAPPPRRWTDRLRRWFQRG